MHVPPTLATLALCVAALILLRLRWTSMAVGVRRFFVVVAVTFTILMALAVVTRVSCNSDHVNVLVYWGFILSYIFFLLLFTLVHPRWLTSLIAIVLILPLLSASAFLPLAGIFTNLPHQKKYLGDGFVSDLAPLEAATPGGSAADLSVYRPLTWAPFLHKSYMSVRYFNTQCDSLSAYAILQPDRRGILMACPAASGFPPEDGRSIVISLYPEK